MKKKISSLNQQLKDFLSTMGISIKHASLLLIAFMSLVLTVLDLNGFDFGVIALVCWVLRGLHFQKPPFAQSKLIRVIKGRILDVAVDIRRGSPTYGKYVAQYLSGDSKEQLFIPRGFAHGFSVHSQEAIIQYKCDAFYAPESEGAIAWNDPELNIDWGLDTNDIILSDKDKRHPYLNVLCSPFAYDMNYYK